MNQKEKAEAIKRQLVIINKLLKKPENKYCADCKRTSPSWASINLGVFVCINCSGCHREIGVHVTKIKSVNLDVWAEDTLKYFQKINNEIANEYWEYKLKKFDFKSIQNDNYKLIKFIRDKYEYKKWINKKKKDPMSLIMQGKFKIKKKHEESDEEDNNENNKSVEDYEEEQEDNSDNENENDNDDDNIKEGFKEVQENDIKQNKTKLNNNNILYSQYTPPFQQINNIFVINNNVPNISTQNKNILEDFNNNNENTSTNLLDFNVQTEKDIKSNDLLSNIQNAYNDPNIDNNINNLNKMNNMIFNMNLNNKSPQFNLINNNNINNNNSNNNFANYKQNNIYGSNLNNNNIQMNKREIQNKSNPIAFNLDYLNKNLSVKASNDKKKKDPFSDLVSFK